MTDQLLAYLAAEDDRAILEGLLHLHDAKLRKQVETTERLNREITKANTGRALSHERVAAIRSRLQGLAASKLAQAGDTLQRSTDAATPPLTITGTAGQSVSIGPESVPTVTNTVLPIGYG